MTKTKRCGRPTAAGTPCRRRTSGGPCRSHSEAGVPAKKALFLAYFERYLTLTDAARETGVSRSTPWRWRRSDPDFAEKLHRLEVVADEIAYEAAEETLAARVADDRATATERVFYLVNASRRRRDGRWENTNRLDVSGKLGVFGAILRLSEDEVERLLKLDDDELEAELRRRFGDASWPGDDRDDRGGSGGPT